MTVPARGPRRLFSVTRVNESQLKLTYREGSVLFMETTAPCDGELFRYEGKWYVRVEE